MNLVQLGQMFEAVQRDGGPDTGPILHVLLALVRDAVVAEAIKRPPTPRFLTLMREHGYSLEDALKMREIVWSHDI